MSKIVNDFIKRYSLDRYLNKRYLDYLILVVALMLAIALDWGIPESTGLIFFVYILLNPLQSKTYASLALVSLVLTPFAIILNREAKADKLAIMTFGFLLLSVVKAIREAKEKKN